MKSSLPLAILHAFLALLFLVFAWFQRNDIDPAVYFRPSSIDATLWFLFYTLIAFLLIFVCFRRLPRWLLILSFCACLVEMVVTGPGLYENLFGEQDFTVTQVSMSAEDPRVELTREFLGAVIALAAVLWLIFINRRVHQAPAPTASSAP